MSRLKIALALGVALIATATTHRASAQQTQTCTERSIRGTYFYTIVGSSITPDPIPFAAIGKLVLNGNGGITTNVTLSENGTIASSQTATGNYVVNTDCTGSFSMAANTGAIVFTFNFVIDSSGEMRAISTTSQTVLTLDAKK